MTVMRHAQKITHFYCRPCADYHLKIHPHYRAMKRRKAKRAEEKAAKLAAEAQKNQQ